MKTYTAAALSLAGFISSVAGHGYILEPTPREPGDAQKAACGQQVFNQQSSDHYGNVQGSLQVANGQSDFNAGECKIWQCKGTKFDDNKANVQSYTAGQTVSMQVEIRAPHTGHANVSIVETATDSVIGDSLISWDVYASNSATIPADQTKFDIKIPSDLGSKCATAGDCVIQWFWDASDINQTYESCIDFTVGGSGSGSGNDTAPASSAAPVASATPSATQAPASSTVPSATPSPTAVAVETPTPSAGAGSGSGSGSEKTYTLETFIAWLREAAGSSNKARREEALRVARAHARAFMN